jgi:hypothetical protein
MLERRGTIYIAPVASYVPSGRMVDPDTSSFSVSWQDWDDDTQTGELLEHGGEVAGAEAAIAWGRERSDRVLIRLGHTEATYFSAGHVHCTDQTDGGGRVLPVWPPDSAPAEGWWTQSAEEAARAEAIKQASDKPQPQRWEWKSQKLEASRSPEQMAPIHLSRPSRSPTSGP